MGDSLYNSVDYFMKSCVNGSGFREYDARWIIEPIGQHKDVEINYRGMLQLGYWLGEFLQLEENGSCAEVIVGHDFRKYSENAKNALTLGLLAAGLDVVDIGLCLTPVVYFSQYDRNVRACAMVTASHNPNGWSGVKMGHDYSSTFGPDRMQAFKEFAKAKGESMDPATSPGKYSLSGAALLRYCADLDKDWRPRLADLPRLRVAVETGNGTAGFVVPDLLRGLGFEVVEGNTKPDWNFPNFNPNPEDIQFLKSVQSLVKGSGADVGICIDGDGDRLGIVDDSGRLVFSDRLGLLIAKWLEQKGMVGKFVVDVKCTSLFSSELASEVIWEKTGHSYIKAAVARVHATAGFERSGHFFFNPPFGRGYDDACLAALMLLLVLCEAKARGETLSMLLAKLPPSHQSPNRQPVVPETSKYDIVEAIIKSIRLEIERTGCFSGVPVTEILTINGIRLHFSDKSWLLIRASSNTPNLVILAESFDEQGERLRAIDAAVRQLLEDFPGVGPFEPLYET
jgi:phosphomannomutase / phosphoglucomutase